MLKPDAVAEWAHRPASDAVPTAVLGAIGYRHEIVAALERVPLLGGSLATFARDSLHVADLNASFRARVLATLMLGEVPTHAALLEALLLAETAWHRCGAGHGPTIDMACYLNAFGRPLISTAQIWEAKCASPETFALVDGQFCVAGAGVAETLQMLAQNETLHAALTHLRAMEDSGELHDLVGWRQRTLLRLRHHARDLLAHST